MKTAFTDFPFFTVLVLMSLSAMKKAITICFVGLTCTLALIGPGWPFLIYCLLILFVSEVWKDTMVSSMVLALAHFFSRPSSSYRRSKIVLIDT